MVTATPCRRGTTNGNARGSSYSRATRRAWLLATYAANVQVVRRSWPDGSETFYYPRNAEDQGVHVGMLEALLEDGVAPFESFQVLATCRCYRCGDLLVDGTLTVDRIIPGVKGGTYRRNNIRPACGACNSETGGALATRKGRKS